MIDKSKPVFPVRIMSKLTKDVSKAGSKYIDYTYTDGLSLRDYFAAKAMQALIQSRQMSVLQHRECAIESYNVADAMLKYRQENPDAT